MKHRYMLLTSLFLILCLVVMSSAPNTVASIDEKEIVKVESLNPVIAPVITETVAIETVIDETAYQSFALNINVITTTQYVLEHLQNNSINGLQQIEIPCHYDCVAKCGINPFCLSACTAERLSCWVLVDAYKSYMDAYVQSGRSYYYLSPQVKNAIAPYIQTAIAIPPDYLNEINVGTSSNAGTNNAIADCDRISWVNSPDGNEIVNGLRGVNQDSNDIIFNSNWVYHEFVHTFQCNELGGRTEYGYNWFDSLGTGLINAILSGQWPNAAVIHDHQPTEQDADQRAIAIENLMPVIIPRYAKNLMPLGSQQAGNTVTFRAHGKNVAYAGNAGTVAFADEVFFMVMDETGAVIETFPGSYETGSWIVWGGITMSDDFTYKYDWTIPLVYEGQFLTYKFQIRDTNGYLMDETEERSLYVVRKYVHVNKNDANCDDNDVNSGTLGIPYCTVGSALTDPEVGNVVSLRIYSATYLEAPMIFSEKMVIEAVNGTVTIDQ